MTKNLDPRRFLIEMDCLGDEWQRLEPLLTAEEKEEKRKENTKRVVAILQREIERIKSDAYDDDAFAYYIGEKSYSGPSLTPHFDEFMRVKALKAKNDPKQNAEKTPRIESFMVH